MAISFTNQPANFAVNRAFIPGQIFFVPGDPGVTYTKGDMVYRSVATTGTGGCILADVDGTAPAIGRVAKTVVCPAATVAFPSPLNFDPADESDSKNKCLVPIELLAPAQDIYNAPVESYIDTTVTSWTPSTRSLVVGAGSGGDHGLPGGLVYIYDGPGKGQWNMVEAYTHGTLTAVLHRIFDVVPTNASSIVIFAGENVAAGAGCSFGGRVDKDNNAIVVNDGYEDGPYIVVPNWSDLNACITGGYLPVLNIGSRALA